MDSIIYELFFGETDLLTGPVPQQEQYLEAVSTFEQAENALRDGLNEEQRRLLLRMSDHHAIALGLIQEAAFLRGFQTGGRLVAELLR